MTDPWRVVVPVKRLDRAKSRLDLPPTARAAVTRAMLVDTLAALAAAPEVGRLDLVSGDASLRSVAATHGAGVLSPGGAVGIDAEVAAALGDETGPVVIVLGDLPCLTAPALARVLEPWAGGRPRFVPDAAGTGTTMVLSPRGVRTPTAFGPGSAARHAVIADRLDAVPAAARRDVDTLDDLAAAASLGLGPATSAWWAAARDRVALAGA